MRPGAGRTALWPANAFVVTRQGGRSVTRLKRSGRPAVPGGHYDTVSATSIPLARWAPPPTGQKAV